MKERLRLKKGGSVLKKVVQVFARAFGFDSVFFGFAPDGFRSDRPYEIFAPDDDIVFGEAAAAGILVPVTDIA